MAQGDFGVVPNVWRPQFVPPINTGEDTQAGIPGNAAANVGATETTITESFFNVPLVGWQKVVEETNRSVVATVATEVRQFTVDTRTPDHLIVIAFKTNGTANALALNLSGASPFTGAFSAFTSTANSNSVGMMVVR